MMNPDFDCVSEPGSHSLYFLAIVKFTKPRLLYPRMSAIDIVTGTPRGCFNPLIHGGISFCLLLKIIMRNPYLKILHLANLFVADAPMKKKFKQFSFTPLLEHFEKCV